MKFKAVISLFLLLLLLTACGGGTAAPESETLETKPAATVVTETETATAEPEDEPAVLLDVPYISQEKFLPNGCEAVSASMVLNYWGIRMKPLDFVNDYLACETLDTEFPGGLIIGPDPYEMYAGDPTNEDDGLGCYSPVIAEALGYVVGGELGVYDTTGTELASLAEYIDEGIPVIVWATIDMERVTDYYEVLYYDRYGSYYYPENEHCLVLVGYNENRYFFADPYESRGIVSYPKSDCEAAFADLGKQSVVVRPQQ